MYSCFSHKNSQDLDHHLLDQNIDVSVELSNKNYCFVTSPGQSTTLTLLVTESVVANIHIFCADSVDLTVRLILLFPELVDIKLSMILCGNSSKITLLGMCALAQNQSVQLQTRQVHCGKESQSRFFLQALLADSASLQYEGTIRIEEQASGTYALQNNKNILLSSQARVISIPNIEVLNHDVQCYHGSAVGRFMGEQMHYMKSRGLDDGTIKQLLVQALFADMLQGYDKREFILKKIYEKI
ncbi:SufD family Fe-S cluster assembly protein [Candidatus Babeliales bacterium]|nr:SufD family Fe-S cluster assembly protein [Candidatus Babeliales bacterium]MBP9843772.1 SufD family Fe-S cluster assembly protein [Candidatus Babeliales bacterium]